MTHLSSNPVELQYPIKYPQGDKHLEKFLISFPGGLFRKLISDIAGELKLIFKYTPPVEKVTCERSSYYYVTSNFVFAIKKFFWKIINILRILWTEKNADVENKNFVKSDKLESMIGWTNWGCV